MEKAQGLMPHAAGRRAQGRPLKTDDREEGYGGKAGQAPPPESWRQHDKRLDGGSGQYNAQTFAQAKKTANTFYLPKHQSCASMPKPSAAVDCMDR